MGVPRARVPAARFDFDFVGPPPKATPPMHPLDNPVWDALHGPHRAVAEPSDLAARYRPEISPFGAFPEPPGPEHWRAMADLVGPGGVVIVTGQTGTPPEGWCTEYAGDGVQMTGEAIDAHPVEVAALRPELGMLPLGEADAVDMVQLVELARPGPFSPRTWELGGYVGVRVDGHLAAMAGQRFRPTGWCEISAVATHPEHRRQGLAEYLVRVVAAGIVARGEVPLLHASADNIGAIRLYEAMGFTHRRVARFVAARAPGDPAGQATPTLPPVRG
jgi:ribosomal protein S18 acetylase RimI-like enzyme